MDNLILFHGIICLSAGKSHNQNSEIPLVYSLPRIGRRFSLEIVMKEIQLTQGQVAKVSDHRFEYFNQWKWCASWNEHTKSYYATRIEYKPFKKEIRMHREIANTPKNMVCDHIDHDTLNNQDDNLRNVTHSQNAMNRRLRSDNLINEKGISCRRPNCFQVRLCVSGKIVFDKAFKTIEEAILARDEAVRKYHGEFGFID